MCKQKTSTEQLRAETYPAGVPPPLKTHLFRLLLSTVS